MELSQPGEGDVILQPQARLLAAIMGGGVPQAKAVDIHLEPESLLRGALIR